MTRFRYLLAALVVAVVAAAVPAAQAQEQACGGISGCNVHVVADGSSAQFLTAALAADQLAYLNITDSNGTGSGTYNNNCTFHWSAKNQANIVDSRSPLINNQLGNIWIVWVANLDGSSPAAGSNITSWTVSGNNVTLVGTGFGNFNVGDAVNINDGGGTDTFAPGNPWTLTAVTSTSITFTDAAVAGTVGTQADSGTVNDTTAYTCATSSGLHGVTDVWTDVSEDSTVGVRTFFAQSASPNAACTNCGAQIQVVAPTPTAGNLVSPSTLWSDGYADVVQLPLECSGGSSSADPNTNGDLCTGSFAYSCSGGGTCSKNAIASALGTSSSGSGDLYVNLGMTDIRPEDALFATDRSNSAYVSSTLAGLGYTTGATGTGANIGLAIGTAQGTGTSAQPVNFGLSGGTDPISTYAVRPSVTIPIGAAPVAFFLNNEKATYYPIDLKSGVEPYESISGHSYPLANLFDGTTYCGFGTTGAFTNNPAFDLFYNAGSTTATPPGTNTSVDLVLREPLSGTMNTTEFNAFRTYGNSKDSQEKGVGTTNNPLNLNCTGGGGNRERAIGTGEVVNAILGTGNAENGTTGALGYIFYSFANTGGKFKGSAQYNYLTIDSVDPIGPSPTAGDYNTCGGTANGTLCAPGVTVCSGGASCLPAENLAQIVPSCPGPCPQTFFVNGLSFPNLRNGTYPVWSIYRWVTQYDIQTEADVYGPAHLAYSADNLVDSTVSDYVPFASGYTCTGGTNNGQYCYNNGQCTGGGTCTAGVTTDSLDVYRSHFQRCTKYTLSTNGTGMENKCASGDEDVPDNGPIATSGVVQGGNGLTPSSAVEVEAGGDVGGYIVGPFPGANGWCPTDSGAATTVTVTNNSANVTIKKSFDFTATSAANAGKYLLNYNLGPTTLGYGSTYSPNMIWIYSPGVGAYVDYTISSVTADNKLVLTTNFQGTGSKATTQDACFDLNWPGPFGMQR